MARLFDEVSYTVLVERRRQDRYLAWIPAFQGCHAEAATPDAAVDRVRRACRVVAGELHRQGRPLPANRAVLVTTVGLGPAVRRPA